MSERIIEIFEKQGICDDFLLIELNTIASNFLIIILLCDMPQKINININKYKYY